MTFVDVKQILDESLVAWKAVHGRDPDFTAHGATFKWNTREELLAASGHGHQLIDPNMIGNGMGAQTNLIIDLRTGINNVNRMPKAGPFISPEKIQVIVDWIDAGCH